MVGQGGAMGNGRVDPPGAPVNANAHPKDTVRAWLARGIDQPGGKLPLFDSDGKAIDPGLVHMSIAQGWAEPWFRNPLKPDWLVCKLTVAGREEAISFLDHP